MEQEVRIELLEKQIEALLTLLEKEGVVTKEEVNAKVAETLEK
jgi:hypothetical protein